MVNRRSAIGQLIDPQGKAVSQNVIVLDSMIKTLSDNATGYKNLCTDMIKLVTRQADVYKTLKSKGVLNEQEADTAKVFLTDFMESCKTMQKKMEEAYAVAAALPQVVEGDRGIYEHENQPAAPLLRRDTGEPMKDYVYGEMVAASREKTGSNTGAHMSGGTGASANTATYVSRSPPVVPLNRFNMVAVPEVQADEDLSTAIDADALQHTFELVKEFVDEVADEDDSMDVNEMSHAVVLASGSVDVFTCICMIVHEYMNVKGIIHVPRVAVKEHVHVRLRVR